MLSLLYNHGITVQQVPGSNIKINVDAGNTKIEKNLNGHINQRGAAVAVNAWALNKWYRQGNGTPVYFQ